LPAGESVVLFSPDRRRVATAEADATIRVRDVASGRELIRLPDAGHARFREGPAIFSPDGRRLAVVDARERLSVWEVDSGRRLFEIRRPMGERIAFSPDGEHLAVVDGWSIDLFRIASGRRVGSQGFGIVHDGHVTQGSVAASAAGRMFFSPDGRGFATEGAGLQVTDLQTGLSLALDRGSVGPARSDPAWINPESGRGSEQSMGVRSIAFSSDSRYLITTGSDDTTRWHLWRMEDLIAEACARLPRNLTPQEWRDAVGDQAPHRAICTEWPAPSP